MNVRRNIIKSLSDIAIDFNLSALQTKIIFDSWEGDLPKVLTLPAIEKAYALKKSHACKVLSKLTVAKIIKKASHGKYLVTLPKRRYSQSQEEGATMAELTRIKGVPQSMPTCLQPSTQDDWEATIGETVPAPEVESFFQEIQTKLNQEKSPFSDGRREDPKDPWVNFYPDKNDEQNTELNCEKDNEVKDFEDFISTLEIWNEPQPEMQAMIRKTRNRSSKILRRFSKLNCEKDNDANNLEENISSEVNRISPKNLSDQKSKKLNCEKDNDAGGLQEDISTHSPSDESFLESHYNKNIYNNNTLTRDPNQEEEYKFFKEYSQDNTDRSTIEMCELEIPDEDWKDPTLDEDFPLPETAIRSDEEFPVDLYGFKVVITGEEALSFALAYEAKLKEYLNQPFLKIISGGYLCRSKRSYKNHVVGAAICKWNKFSVSRFVEAQFFLHDEWKGTAPTIKYITSVGGVWGSEARYQKYCDRFKDDLDYFGGEKDNIEKSIFIDRTPDPEQEMRVRHIAVAQNEACLEHYAGKGLSEYETLKFLCVPGDMHLPDWFVEDRPTYHQLLKDRAWGDLADTSEFCKRVMAKIEHV